MNLLTFPNGPHLHPYFRESSRDLLDRPCVICLVQIKIGMEAVRRAVHYQQTQTLHVYGEAFRRGWVLEKLTTCEMLNVISKMGYAVIPDCMLICMI